MFIIITTVCVYACIDFNGNSSHRFTDVHLHVLAHANVHIFLLSKVSHSSLQSLESRQASEDSQNGFTELLRAEERRKNKLRAAYL